MGGSFGTAIFGAIFANVITGKLHHYLAGVKLPPTLHSTSVSPELLDKLPAAIKHGYQLAFASSLGIVFLVAVPIAFVAFLLSLWIPEGRLRGAGEHLPPRGGEAGTDEVVSPGLTD
jgi:hypothetical protein